MGKGKWPAVTCSKWAFAGGWWFFWAINQQLEFEMVLVASREENNLVSVRPHVPDGVGEGWEFSHQAFQGQGRLNHVPEEGEEKPRRLREERFWRGSTRGKHGAT